MSVSRIVARPENLLDETERRLPDEDTQWGSPEDAGVADLARRLAPARLPSLVRADGEVGRRGADPMRAIEAAIQEAVAAVLEEANPTAIPPAGSGGPRASHDLRKVDSSDKRRRARWTRHASAIAPAGAALVGAALVIAVCRPWAGAPPKPLGWLAASQEKMAVPEPSGETVAAKGDVDATRRSAIAPATVVSFVQIDDRPSAIGADGPSAVGASARLAPPTSAPAPNAAPVAPVAATDAAAPAPSQSPAAPAPSDATKAVLHGAPLQSAEPAPAADHKAVALLPPTAPKADLPMKLQRRASFRSAAKTDEAAPGAAAEMRRDPQSPDAPPTAPGPEPQASPAPAAPQEPVNLVARAFGALTGGLGARSPDQTKSGGWAIQFAAPKSEAEAEAAAARLNAKYAGALNGAMIAVHKTEVNGETIYALRVAGLSKADAAALCERVKGRDCSVVK